MSYLYDRLNRRRVEQPAVSNQEEIPTLEDYSDLLQSYRNLHSRYDQQSAELKAKVSELAIKDEALQRQGSDLKEAEAELLFLRAALQKKQVEGGDEPNWQQQFENLQTEMEQVRKRWEQRFAQTVVPIACALAPFRFEDFQTVVASLAHRRLQPASFGEQHAKRVIQPQPLSNHFPAVGALHP